MTIKQLQKICHKIAKEKGFWDDVYYPCYYCNGKGFIIEGIISNKSFNKLFKSKLGLWDNKKLKTKEVKTTCRVCGGAKEIKYNTNIPEKLMLIVSELGEALEALRKGDLLSKNNKYYNRAKSKVKWKPNSFEDELADTIIRICDLAEYMGIDLEWHLKKKIAYNKKRPYKHNKKF